MIRLTALILSGWAAAQAVPLHAASAASRAPLDTLAVHKMYIEGDFDHAVAVLEAALRENRVPTHADSVFALKHLGVMYAARYETRETGKRYMYQLCYIEPTARIMDMYASDMIYMIFKNIQEEVEINRVKNAKGRPGDTAAGPKGRPKTAGKPAWPYWTAGAVATAVGAGVITYFVLSEEGSGPNHGVPDP